MNTDKIKAVASEILGALPCGFENWSKIWGDPLISGTVFMLFYGIAGLKAIAVAKQLHGRERTLWRVSALILFFQLINTHLDLHAFVVSYGRCLSKAQEWYEIRRQVQYTILVAAVAVMATLLVMALVYFRRSLASNLLLIAGLAICIGITVLKGINYHDLETIYAGKYGPFRGADMIELTGLAVILGAVFFKQRRSSSKV
ncbi:hypothetical protein [Roseovarius aestuariivivens]|uniref:hypothetical protein n=1 Tax=Roseovarius aestuariivivens TaxID=1888910 RepID=UPI0010806F9C|nr:hypothetical protein [Roseovarius aestuariivivens]